MVQHESHTAIDQTCKSLACVNIIEPMDPLNIHVCNKRKMIINDKKKLKNGTLLELSLV